MKKNALSARRLLAAVMAAAVIFGVIPIPHTNAQEYESAYIQRLDNSLAADYTAYLDENVAFRLPQSLGADEQISVIIDLGGDTVLDIYEQTDRAMSLAEFAATDAAQTVRRDNRAAQAALLEALDGQSIPYTLGQDYDVLLNGFELLIRAGDYSAVCMSLDPDANAIIGQEYRAQEAELVENPTNVYTDTGIFDSSNVAYDGTGMVVAVLDTGLDSNHSAFAPENFDPENLGLTYEQVAGVLGQTEASALNGDLSVDDVYINQKVPFGYDYADNDPDVYSTHNNHGTHVSGVIVGDDDTITGVAPNAQLVAMKIFSDVMDTARSSWILAALEDCVVLGVDVINMSLGTACGFSRESDEEQLNGVYDKIREAGISVVVAASNSYSSAYGSEKNGNLGLTSNPDTGTVGSPGTYEGMLSVASISGTETPYLLYDDTIIYFDEANDAASQELDFCETLLGDQDSVEIEYVLVPGVGRSADYTGLDVTGKIALVRRGDNTFEEKAIIAQAQGAAGIIIYNNVSGDIKMNVGDAELAVCSISQDNGEMLAAAGSGKLTISREQTSGPFISDFSSWGPTPDLKIKPEITGHGGNILSSVTGGGYDRLSGTSMACPNLSGVVVLLRQYVVENFPEIADDNVAVNAMVNRLLMSTAQIALSTNGLPYSVRKQGAGLASLDASVQTPACIITYDAEGNAMDKTKLELGDDPEKTGVYRMSFSVSNFGDKALTYELGSYVFTEGVSDTRTNAGETTVTEEAYILPGAGITIDSVEGGKTSGKKITVEAGEQARVEITLTLSDEDKAYLDSSFENGMYVEGYLMLTPTSGTDVSLNVPYLAFYGDWSQAPLFDLTYYETNADELNDAIDEEDKTKADAYATRLVGGLMDDYVSYLGTYYFLQNPEDMVISATEDYIALSNQEGTVHSLRFVWAGMLRNARQVEITVTDDTTGQVIFETVDTDVRKSYGDGGSIYPANIEVEFDTMDYDLANNSTYTVTVTGWLDYEDGGQQSNEKYTYSFPLTVDFEAPTLTDVEFYYEYDKSEECNRLYAKAAVYDNHYAMSAQLGYVGMGADEDDNPTPELIAFEQYLTPVYSQRNSTTYVTFELTDWVNDIKENAINANSIVITCYDYALNYATYEVGLPDEYVDFYFEGLEGELTLSPNETYPLAPMVYPDSAWGELLEYTSSRPSIVRVVNNTLVAAAPGSAVIKVRDPGTNKSVTFKVTVLEEDHEDYRRYDKPVADEFALTGYTTMKAFYIVANADAELGYAGDRRFFEGNYSLSMYPSESVYLNYELDAYFPNDTAVEFETSNENIVTVDAYGNVTAVAEGFASVTVKVMLDGRSTYYSETVSVEVKDPYVATGGILSHYYGRGGVVMIPEDLALTEIGAFAFSNFDYVEKTEEELAFDDSESMKQWFIGESMITKVVIPEGVKKINAYAFANLTALEEIVLPSTLQAIEYGAFFGCTALEKISFSGENHLQIINQNAFENCNLQGTVDLSAACVISDYAFAGNVELEGLITSESLLSIGEYAFAGCKKLNDVTITAEKVKYGPYAFTDCESLNEFYVNASVIPEGMFYECKGLKKVSVGPDVNSIGQFAFRDTAVNTIEICQGNTAFRTGSGAYVLSADGTVLAAVAPTLTGSVTAAELGGSGVTVIGDGAFSHNTRLTSVSMPQVTAVGDYGFGSSKGLTAVELGTLTKIGEYAFFETGITQLPAFTAQTQMGQYAFCYTAITQVTVPDGMVIPEGTFSECMDLQSVVIGDDVTVGKYAFSMNKDNIFTIKSYEVEVLTGDKEVSDSGNVQIDDPEINSAINDEQAAEVTTQDSGRRFYYEFSSPLTSLTIGDNAQILDNAFQGAASLEAVELGANAQIGYMAFYNNCSLKQIDLSQATSIGDYAFSGDVYYVCIDDSMAYVAVSPDGYYIYTYHASALESVDLSSVEEVGEYAFAYCRSLKDVKLNEQTTRIAPYTFSGCIALENIDLSGITQVGEYAFIECAGLTGLDLSAAEEVGEYAFVYCEGLETVKLNSAGTTLGEGSLSYCENLVTVENLGASPRIDDYAFAYTALTEADLSAAESVGKYAFMKEESAPLAVTLGDGLRTLGDNPFAMCQVEPFCILSTEDFNGMSIEQKTLSYDISDTVMVINGSLYIKEPNGPVLITYTGADADNFTVADGTVRIGAMAFAGSDIRMATLPYTVEAVGHKAFYDCRTLEMVIFNTYDAPIMEEEFDPTYYETFANLPGTGEFGSYTDYDGSEVTIEGMGLLPYYMWNATDGLYSNVFYGANFVDYVGHVEDKLTMVRPVNGKNYDSFVLAQYFDLIIDGPAAPDKTTVAAIRAIDAIGEKVTYEQRHVVEAARAAYGKIATLEQQALVTNYAQLISAEQRILALTPEQTPAEGEQPEQEQDGSSGFGIIGVIVAAAVVVLAAAGGVAGLLVRRRRKASASGEQTLDAAEEPEAESADQTETAEEKTEE